MSQIVRCEQCGGEDFRLESGFYFCSECQLQSQDIREHVLDTYYAGAGVSARKLKKTDEEKELLSQQGPGGVVSNLSSVELLNFVLKGLVDELIILGAPKKLKIITLQLWASYLRKNEIAFTSMSVPEKPKFGMWHRRGDVARFYKVRKPLSLRSFPDLLRKKRKAASKKPASKKALLFESLTHRSKKLRLTASKTSLARAEYGESGMESSISMSLATSLASLDLTQGSQSSVTSVGERILYSKEGKKDINSYLKQVGKEKDKVKFHKQMWDSRRKRVNNLRTELLVAILRIALVLSGSDIHPGDFFRWSDEGYFSYTCMRKLLPPHVKLTEDQCYLFKSPPSQILYISRNTSNMVRFLGVTNVGISPSEIIINLVRRYCKLFNLPDIISSGIDQLLKLKPPKVWLDSGCCNYEGRAMGLILFSLKILIGLDDVTEYNYTPRKGVEGVKWEEWCRQYEARMAEKAIHHFPTLVQEYPGSYVGRNHSFLSHWDPASGSGNNNLTKAERSMGDCFQRTLKPLICNLAEPSWRPGLELEPSGPPLAVLSECIDGSVRRGVRNLILMREKKREKTVKAKPKDARNIRVRVLDDDADIEKKKDQQKKLSHSGARKVVKNEDYSIWVYHTDTSWECNTYEFIRTAGSKLPHSFWWLLNQMAHAVHQTPLVVYRELVRVEKVFYYGEAASRIKW